MEYCEVWSIPPDRLAAFFRQHALEDADGFLWEGCRIVLTALPPRPMGPWPMPQTRVEISGPNAENIYRQFFQTFISAGG
ncbi:MAG: hypothetical protein Q4F17_09995 [Eubacteriales bacterium]|nr:hypothetical protein [Eubacteriales bacterium]